MARQQRVDWGDGERDHQTNGGGDHHLNGEQFTKKGEERIDDWGRDNVIEGSNGRLSPGDGDVEIGMDSRCTEEHIPLQSQGCIMPHISSYYKHRILSLKLTSL